jgi:hypothetical protein
LLSDCEVLNLPLFDQLDQDVRELDYVIAARDPFVISMIEMVIGREGTRAAQIIQSKLVIKHSYASRAQMVVTQTEGVQLLKLSDNLRAQLEYLLKRLLQMQLLMADLDSQTGHDDEIVYHNVFAIGQVSD